MKAGIQQEAGKTLRQLTIHALFPLSIFTEPLQYNALLDVVEKSKPFYPLAIHEALSAVREKCHHELIDYEYVERPNSEYYKEARKNQEEILQLIEAVCDAIRTRVTKVQAQ